MHKPAQLNKINALYTDNLQKHGLQSKAVGWNTENCQSLRFQQLCKLLEQVSSPFSVLDYGCGYGSLAEYIDAIWENRITEYQGYDISEKMLEEARQTLTNKPYPISLFNEPQIQSTADFGFVSGTFNVKFDASEKDWKSFIHDVLAQLNTHSNGGFAFNMLSTYVDWQEEHLYYSDPCYWFDYCKKHFSKYVSLIHDYPLWEWTLIVKK
ncbi:class I SAM-dependent methyltransferase [Bowmanella denitrificans]|uniref:class I SAM-dependent methyltransferase n=1 Tax=Bowmanella denitrificans TaxID=366582 RepID=UPI000C9AC0B5|nr:class I SAM-dependent methyltransferase [Bowmanella denitrificans]